MLQRLMNFVLLKHSILMRVFEDTYPVKCFHFILTDGWVLQANIDRSSFEETDRHFGWLKYPISPDDQCLHLSTFILQVGNASVEYGINTFKYHVSCTDGKFSVRIKLLFYHYFPPLSHLIYVRFCPVRLSLL